MLIIDIWHYSPKLVNLLKIIQKTDDKKLLGVFAIYRDVLSDFNFDFYKEIDPIIIKIADLEKNSQLR